MPTKKKSLLAWHFLPRNMRLTNGDGRLVTDGQVIKHQRIVRPCVSGLHASLKVLDALKYADSLPILCRVRVGGDIVHHTHSDYRGHPLRSDKLAASERTVLWHVDATAARRLTPFVLGLIELEVMAADAHPDMKLVRSRARALRGLLQHFFGSHECFPKVSLIADTHRAHEAAQDHEWRVIRLLYAGKYCTIAYRATRLRELIKDDESNTDLISRTFRKLVGQTRRGTIHTEITKIATRLNTLSKMSDHA